MGDMNGPASVATIANWGANFVVTISVLTLLGAITPMGSFFLFGFLSVVALVYFAKRVPETKQRSLQEIERDLGAQLSEAGAGSRLSAQQAGLS
jgi:uncharacterized membrane protein YphA (DoxX/SURF4 family)